MLQSGNDSDGTDIGRRLSASKCDAVAGHLSPPPLAGKPIVVGGRGGPIEQAVVSTASYEARAFGVGSGMPLRIAARKVPDAVVLPVDHEAYLAASETVMATLRAQPGATVQVLGWDEAFVGIETERPEAYA